MLGNGPLAWEEQVFLGKLVVEAYRCFGLQDVRRNAIGD
jgi:hypothetical protein